MASQSCFSIQEAVKTLQAGGTIPHHHDIHPTHKRQTSFEDSPATRPSLQVSEEEEEEEEVEHDDEIGLPRASSGGGDLARPPDSLGDAAQQEHKKGKEAAAAMNLGDEFDGAKQAKQEEEKEEEEKATVVKKTREGGCGDSNASSAFVGVSWHKVHQKWHAQARTGETISHLGYFYSEEEARKAYEDFALKRQEVGTRDTTIVGSEDEEGHAPLLETTPAAAPATTPAAATTGAASTDPYMPSGLTWQGKQNWWTVQALLPSPTDVPWMLCNLPRRPKVGNFAHYCDAVVALRKAQEFLDGESKDGEWTVQRATRAVLAVRRMGEKLMTTERERDDEQRDADANGGVSGGDTRRDAAAADNDNDDNADDDNDAKDDDDDDSSSFGTPPPPRASRVNRLALKRKPNDDRVPEPPASGQLEGNTRARSLAAHKFSFHLIARQDTTWHLTMRDAANAAPP